MSDLKHIRRQAAECREKAQAATDQDQRERRLRLADEYCQLASEIEESIGRVGDSTLFGIEACSTAAAILPFIWAGGSGLDCRI